MTLEANDLNGTPTVPENYDLKTPHFMLGCTVTR